jgi:hypothetical protein
MKINIERQVESPVFERCRGRVYPFHELQVGDCFNIFQDPDDKIEHRRIYMNVINCSRNFERKVPGVKFFVHKTSDGISCYRKS